MTKVTFELAKAIAIGLGKAGSIDVDTAKLAESPAVLAYVFNYGLKQMLNDVHSQEKDAKAKFGLVEKKLDSLYAGQVAQTRASGGDPVMREMRVMAEADIRNAMKAKGIKAKDVKADVIRAMIDKQVVSAEAKYRKAAEAKLAITVQTTVDADDILAMLN